ncbi:MAG: hypothetical protein E7473_00800 [Ruminococcaceae bacterium]|nr:hypothetical protein [Oscillospiraceae bacterium]
MQKTRFGISAQAYAGLAFLSGIISPIITLVMTGAALIVEENDWLKRMVLKAFAFVLIMGVAEIVLGKMSFNLKGDITAESGLVTEAFKALLGLLSYMDESLDVSKIAGFFGLLGTIVYILKVIFLMIFAKKAFAGQYVKLPVVDGIVEKNVQ